ncbi:uncharacterized protein LOC126681501 [Mercurialis annua]|uniref:uncharacterized protein LOC126681501 n=1 Tax=Mercurialis annua TaxID=3986 RepID=UPI0021609D01|nr:uncharacterized protein LOC126681501 [Mercurialis annua]
MRKNLWKKLIDISKDIQGDFDAVLNNNDRCGGNELDEEHAIELQNCVSAAGLFELRSIGCFYTWNNNQLGDNRIWRRLDRVFSNGNTSENHNVYFEALPNGISDHSPIITTIQDNQYRGKKKDIIEEEWSKDYNGYWMFKIVQKLKSISYRLNQLNKQHYSKISQKVNRYKVILDQLQIDIQKDLGNSFLIDEERAMAIQLKNMLRCEESFYKQKSRIQWLNLGDSNTKYFHNSIKQRRAMNSIPLIKLDDGRIINSQKDILEEMTRFYTNLVWKNIL